MLKVLPGLNAEDKNWTTPAVFDLDKFLRNLFFRKNKRLAVQLFACGKTLLGSLYLRMKSCSDNEKPSRHIRYILERFLLPWCFTSVYRNSTGYRKRTRTQQDILKIKYILKFYYWASCGGTHLNNWRTKVRHYHNSYDAQNTRWQRNCVEPWHLV